MGESLDRQRGGGQHAVGCGLCDHAQKLGVDGIIAMPRPHLQARFSLDQGVLPGDLDVVDVPVWIRTRVLRVSPDQLVVLCEGIGRELGEGRSAPSQEHTALLSKGALP